MQAYFGEQAHIDQLSAILDSNSEEAWGETKMRPREWEMTANLRSQAPKRLHCRLGPKVLHS